MAFDTSVDDAPALADVLARRTEILGAAALRDRGRFAIALPGGSVAQTFLPRLSRAGVDWKRADFFWGDERAVPPDHADSNFGLAQSLWLRAARLPAERIHRMRAEAPASQAGPGSPDLDAAAQAYESDMERALGSPPVLDLALLGVGPDGHVCSLFPGHSLLEEGQRFVAAITNSPKPPARRLTLTLPALFSARLVVVAAFGEAKAAVMREALEDAASRLPVALALRGAKQALVLLDPAAAGR